MNKRIRSLTAVAVAVCILLSMSVALAVPVEEDEAALYEQSYEQAKAVVATLDANYKVRSNADFTWNDILRAYPDVPRETMEIIPNMTWIDFFGWNIDRGYGILGFHADGSTIEYEEMKHTYLTPGQHFMVGYDYDFSGTIFALVTLIDAASSTPSQQPTHVPSFGTTTTRPGVNITINNTNVNINGTNTSISTDIAGLVRLAQALNGSRPLSSVEVAAWDFNRNGNIDITDLVIMASLLY